MSDIKSARKLTGRVNAECSAFHAEESSSQNAGEIESDAAAQDLRIQGLLRVFLDLSGEA